MNTPAVSVVMAVKNCGRYLRSALDSISGQTFQDFEIIVVDGGSTDDSRDIVGCYPKARCVQQCGTGFAEAWNEGIMLSRGQFITFLDGDDLWEPQKLALQAAILCDSPSTEYVVGRLRFFADANGQLPLGFRSSLLGGTHLAYMPGTIMIRRTAIDRIGAFAEGWTIASDLEWFSRLRDSELGVTEIDSVLLNKRVHANNLSYSTCWQTYRRELLQILRARLDRRRLERGGAGLRSGE